MSLTRDFVACSLCSSHEQFDIMSLSIYSRSIPCPSKEERASQIRFSLEAAVFGFLEGRGVLRCKVYRCFRGCKTELIFGLLSFCVSRRSSLHATLDFRCSRRNKENEGLPFFDSIVIGAHQLSIYPDATGLCLFLLFRDSARRKVESI